MQFTRFAQFATVSRNAGQITGSPKFTIDSHSPRLRSFGRDYLLRIRSSLFNSRWLEDRMEALPMWHHGMYGGGFGFGFMFLHLLGNLFFLALLIGAIMFFVRGGRFAGGRGPGNWGGWSRSMRGNSWMNNFAARDGALEVARTRLAKSEITPEQYEELRKGLEAREQARAQAAERSEPGFSWRRDDALETARMRFATGEITHEQFEVIRSTLER
jgi:uncharacterized membrane protein